ncbi:MAG TPA: hypothetical protein VM305_07320 [Candidatus Limnocylindrales bacterium]|nr:hypothetical protein [Candidatus Limnocylindrales bacterium]
MSSGAVLLTASRRARLRRTPLLVLVGLLIAVWVVLSFGRTLGALNESSERLEQVRAETVALQTRIAQGQAEMELAQTPAFQRMLARSFGMGMPGEQAFALEPDAGPPPAVVPLGGRAGAADDTPLEAWLQILLGD